MLFSSGWRLDDVLDLSWTQITVVVSCVLSYKVEQANIVTDAVTTALGGKVEKKGSKRKRPNRAKRQESKDRAVLAHFANHGFDVGV